MAHSVPGEVLETEDNLTVIDQITVAKSLLSPGYRFVYPPSLSCDNEVSPSRPEYMSPPHPL